MKRCRTMPDRWDARGDWSHRCHTLFCPECRAARRADRKLARGARTLYREPLPPGLDARLLDSLGLPAEQRPVQTATSGRAFTNPGYGPDSGGPSGARTRLLVPIGAAAVGLLTLAVLLTRWHEGGTQQHPTALADRILGGSIFTTPGKEHPPTASVRPDSGGEFAGVRTSVRFERRRTSHRVANTDRPAPPATPRIADGTQHPPSRPTPGDDLAYLNAGTPVPPTRWVPLSRNEWEAIEARMRRQVQVRDDFITIPFPRLATTSARQVAAAVKSYKREAAVVDARLAREVTVGLKATALADVCDRLRSDSGIQLAAGPSVTDEKVTLFCEKLPLREVMRQLARPFGYAWLRSGLPSPLGTGEPRFGRGADSGGGRAPGAGGRGYRYELVQDLKSQLVEEELRNHDRNQALLALEKDFERYRPYLNLSPDEALAHSKSAGPGDRQILEQLSGIGWGPLHLYPLLTSQELAALRAGQEVTYSEAPRPGEQPRSPDLTGGVLPPDIARGELQSLRWRRLIQTEDGWEYTPETDLPGVLPPAAIPEARAVVRVKLSQSDLGQFTLNGTAALFTIGKGGGVHWYGSSDRDFGQGLSPSAQKPENAVANARLARDPSLRGRVTVEPVGRSPWSVVGRRLENRPTPPDHSPPSPPKVTTADVLEALHRATGMPIVADFYTRLYKPEAVTVKNQPLFAVLNQLGDAMRMRWHREDGWLQLRSTTYYDDRLKEVPNRLLTRWAEARRRQGSLRLDDLCEIGRLSDAQLDGGEMAEGAREWWDLEEWDLACTQMVRGHLRYLASFTPAQRQEAVSPAGLPFTRMTLAQQQQYIALGVGGDSLQSLEELQGAVMRVDYTQPGGFQWGEPGWSGYYTRWVVPLEPGSQGRRVPRPPVRERTREAALQAVRRLDPQLRESLLQAVRRVDPRVGPDQDAFETAQIFPTGLDLVFVYIPGATNARSIFVMSTASRSCGHCNAGLR